MATKDQKKKSNPKRIALYLDDLRTPTEEPPGFKWKVVRNYKEFTDFLTSFYRERKELPGLISFDHDLGEEHMDYYHSHPNEAITDYGIFKEKTGLHCAKWLTEVCDKNNISLEKILISVHSHNPVGANNIKSYLNNYKKHKYGAEKADCFERKWPFKFEN